MSHIVDAHYWRTIADLNRDNANLLERIKHLEKLLSIVAKGPRRDYKNGPEEYFAALKETWKLLEEREP